MASTALEKIERIVRNLPITGITYRYSDTPHGKLYLALGKNEAENKYIGLWGFLVGPGIAQVMEFEKNQLRKACLNTLEIAGLTVMQDMDKRKMLEPGFFRGR
jgi:hypothetical protein